MSSHKIFVINLDRSPGRLAGMKEQLDAIGADFERVAAVDGKNLEDDEKVKRAFQRLRATPGLNRRFRDFARALDAQARQ